VPAPRKYDQETRDRAVRLFEERRRDFPDESALTARKRIGELLDVKHDTMRGWIEQRQVDTGTRSGMSVASLQSSLVAMKSPPLLGAVVMF